MDTFLTIIKQIFSNIILIFRNFFHWTLSKIIIVIFSFFLALLSFLPFFIILVILGLLDAIPWGEVFLAFASGSLNFAAISAFSSAPVFFVIEALIAIIGIAIAIGIYHYKEILLYRLISSYKEGDRLGFKQNLSVKYFKKYLKIFPKIFFFLSLPIVGYVIYLVVIFLLAGGSENILATVQAGEFNYISILLLVGFVISGLAFFYIYYRFIFIYPILAFDTNKSNAEIFQRSRDLTRGPRIFLLLGVVVLYAIVMQPTSYLENNYSDTSFDLNTYYELRLLEQIPKNESFADYGITAFKNYEEVTLIPEFISLDSKFRDIDILTMEAKISKYEFFGNILYVFNFLVFYGLFEVILFSLYTYFVPKKKETHSIVGKLLAGVRRNKKEL